LRANAIYLRKNEDSKRPFAATVWREGKWYVSQCMELDVDSQGETEEKQIQPRMNTDKHG